MGLGAATAILVAGFFFGSLFGMVAGDGGNVYQVAAGKAITQCEASLPRDQQCEAVITARERDNNDEN